MLSKLVGGGLRFVKPSRFSGSKVEKSLFSLLYPNAGFTLGILMEVP